MASVVSSIVYVKSVSGEKTCTGIAYSRVDDEEFVKINFKAFRNNYENMIHEIKKDSIMMMTGKFLNVGSELEGRQRRRG